MAHRHIPLALLACALLVSVPALLAGEREWTEVKSEHFRVLTDGGASSGRRVAREFEQIRAVFSLGFPNMKLDTGAVLTIFAVSDESSMKSLAPSELKHMSQNVGGYFQDGWERRFAVVRLDAEKFGYQVVYHEYVHTLLHANFASIPTWLDEGLAEYYGNTRFEQTKMFIGAPPARVHSMRGTTVIPIEELIDDATWRRYEKQKDDRMLDLCYAEAWALVHYMVFGPEMEKGEKVSRFYGLVQKGEPQKHAFEEVFGSFKDMQQAFEKYAYRAAYNSYEVANPPNIQEKDFAARRMSAAEAELGTYQVWCRDAKDAHKTLDRALKGDPANALAHEALGFLYFDNGQDSEAAEEFRKAYEADKRRYLSLFYKTIIGGRPKSGATNEQLNFRATMYDVLAINKQFAPAIVELVLACLRDDDPPNALTRARIAEGLEPRRAGYHLLTAKILLKMGRERDAEEKVKFVQEGWRGPDHNEAVDLWNRIPTDKRDAGAVAVEESPEGTKNVVGALKSFECEDKGQGIKVAIETGQGTLEFSTKTRQSLGYSDTLWYGRDHFNPCHHTEGLQTIVRYKAAVYKPLDGEWEAIEFRDDSADVAMKGSATSAPSQRSAQSDSPPRR